MNSNIMKPFQFMAILLMLFGLAFLSAYGNGLLMGAVYSIVGFEITFLFGIVLSVVEIFLFKKFANKYLDI